MSRWTDDLTDTVVRRFHPDAPNCSLCGSDRTRRDERDGRYVGWREWVCRECGAGFRED